MGFLMQEANNGAVIAHGYIPVGTMPAFTVCKGTGHKTGRNKRLKQKMFKTQQWVGNKNIYTVSVSHI